MSVRTDGQSKQPFTGFSVVRLLARIFRHFNAIDANVADVNVNVDVPAAPGPAGVAAEVAVIVAATALT